MSVDGLQPELSHVCSIIFTAMNPFTVGKTKSMDADKYLKDNASLWPQVLSVMASRTEEDEQVVFYCLSLLESYTRQGVSFKLDLMSLVHKWLDSGRLAHMSRFVRNKIAHTVSRCIMSEYPAAWPTAFKDMGGWWSKSAEHADLFLRICLSLSDELSGDYLDDTKEDPAVTRVKDCLREGDISHLVQTWRLLITDHAQKGLVSSSLKCIAGCAPWIDVNLTANPELLQHIYRCLQVPEFRCDAIACLTAIVSKGMPVGEKLKLIAYLNLQSVFSGALQMQKDDEDFFEKACRLLNVAGTTLLAASPGFDQAVFEYLTHSLVPILTDYLGSTDGIECLLVLSSVSCSVPEYFKRKPGMAEPSWPILLPLFKAVIKVIKHPDEFDFDCPGELEELFPELRQKFLSSFDQLLNLCGPSASQYTLDLMSQASDGGAFGRPDAKQRELGLYLAFRYFDAHRGYCFSFTTPSGGKTMTPFGQIVSSIVSCRLDVQSEAFIFATFLDFACRLAQTNFFEMFPESYQVCLQNIASAFSAPQRDLTKRVYLAFSKLVKSQRALSGAVEPVIHATRDLFNRFDDEADDVFQCKLEFYEAIGYLNGLQKTLWLQDLDTSLHNPQSSLKSKLNVIRATGAYLKGLSEGSEKQALAVGDVARLSDSIAWFLSRFPSVDSFEAAKYFCQRTIGITRVSALPLLSNLVAFAQDSHDEALIASILQVLSASIFKLKTDICPLLSQIWGPLGQTIKSLCLSSTTTTTATTNDCASHSIVELKRQTMALLISLFSSHIATAMLSIANEPYIAVAADALHEPDFALKRAALSVFTRFAGLTDFAQIDLILDFIVKTVLPVSISGMQGISKEQALESNHQSFTAEFCNLAFSLLKTKYCGETRLVLQQRLGVDVAHLADQRALKAFLTQTRQ